MQLAMLLRNGMDLAWRHRVPGQLVLQMTDKCNARCPQCQMRVTERFERSTLSVDEMKGIIDAAAAKGIRVLSFTGGEPMLMLDELTELIQHAGRAGIQFIRTGTNGYLFKNPQAPGWEDRVKWVAERLAATPLRNFWISIDSAVPAVHERMRGFPGLIAGIERALPIFHSFGLFPSANLGLNRNVGGDATWNVFEDQFEGEDVYLEAFYYAVRRALGDFYRQVREMGFTMANTCYPMSIEGAEQMRGLNAVYGATSSDRVIRFSDGERAMLFKALFDTV
ncbi:MAG: radical SAM protein, partial [Candidatus Hydrogenedentes bacterium]|nr:radical SAM protein [Candidatus Hydrogenedentota bacterium]